MKLVLRTLKVGALIPAVILPNLLVFIFIGGSALATTPELIQTSSGQSLAGDGSTAAGPAPKFLSELELNLSSAQYRKYKLFDGTSYTDYKLQLTYLQHIEDTYQLGGSLGSESRLGKSYLTAVVLLNWNSSLDFQESWFVQAGAGGRTIDELEENSNEIKQVVRLSAELNLGRRVMIREHFSFKPYLGLVKTGKNETEVIASILNFSFHW